MQFSLISCIIIILLANQVILADDTWHSYKLDSGYDNRQELVILEAVSEENFHVGQHVFKWKSISLGGLNYALGLMPTSITLMTARYNESEKRFVSNHTIIEFKKKLLDATLLEKWNSKIRKPEVIAVLAFAENQTSVLEWYRIRSNRTAEIFWKWNLPKKVMHVRCFKHDGQDKLLLISEGTKNDTSADLYQFNMGTDFWLTQHIPLANPTNSTSISTFRQNCFLSVPQKSLNLTLIYKYVKDRFTFFKNITCIAADNVVSFNIGFKSFLAIAGQNGAIFQFNKTSLQKLEVIGSHLEGVRFWYKIPTSNFRDETILLAQREVDHDSHISHSLETIMHNDNQFVLHEEFTCSFHGETVSGLRCVLDEEREEGIVGMTALAAGDTIGLLVPRKDAPSGLLMLRTVMKKIPDPARSEMEKIKETREALEKFMNDNVWKNHGKENLVKLESSPKFGKTDSVTLPAYKSINLRSNAENLNLSDLDQQLDELKGELLSIQNLVDQVLQQTNDTNRKIKTLVLNGIVEIQGGGNFETVSVDKINGDLTNEILADVVKLEAVDDVLVSKTFTNIQVENLNFQTINGIPAENIAYDAPKGVTLAGDIVFTGPVHIIGNLSSGKLNDFVLENEIINTRRSYNGTLNFEHIELLQDVNTRTINRMPIHSRYLEEFTPRTDLSNIQNLQLNSLYVPVHVTATNVNGENFTNFLNSLCMKNVNTYIPGDIIINGSIQIVGDATTQYLNNVKFPEEYVLKKSSGFTQVTGQKKFTETLYANEVTTKGTINKIDPQTIITLSKNQTILGTVTFRDFEVTESLDVDGNKIVGPYVKHILPNPTILEANVIDANVIFQQLHVNGSIILSGNFNGSNFELLLSDILHKDEEKHRIDSIKEFPSGLTIGNGLKIKSNTINNIPLDLFVTKDTEQLLKHPLLLGSTIFENLHLEGLYDKVNVSKLDQETVKISGDQFLSSSLIFADDVSVNKLNISESLNNIPAENYLFTNSDFTTSEDEFVKFLNVTVEKIQVHGNTSLLNMQNFDLEDFDRRRLSFTKKQTINGSYNVNQSNTNTMKSLFVNEIPYDRLFNVTDTLKQLAPMVYSGRIRIKDLHVNGSLQIDEINGIDTDTLLNAFTWNRKLQIPGINVIFKNITMFGNLQTKNINTVVFDTFSDDLVYQHERNIEFEGYKTYTKGLDVMTYLETEELNGVPVTNILTKRGKQKIEGPIVLYGDVFINSNTEISDNLNNIPLHYLKNNFKNTDDGYEIEGDVYFERLIGVRILNASIANDIYLPSYFNDMVYRNRNSKINGNAVFLETVTIGGNLAIKNSLNGVILSELLSNAVLTTKDSEIESVIEFQRNVLLSNCLEVLGDLETRYLKGVDLEHWFKNAMYTNNGILEGTFVLQNTSIREVLYTRYINDMDVKSLIPLKSEQTVKQPLEFEQISSESDIPVNGFVNGYNLTMEFKNTLLNEADEDVVSDAIFEEPVFVKEHLWFSGGLVNGIPLTKMVTTTTDQSLSDGNYKLNGHVTVESELTVEGNVSGINLKEWSRTSVKKTALQPQNVQGYWNVEGNLTFAGDVESLMGTVNDLDLWNVTQQLQQKRNNKNMQQKKFAEDYRNICQDVNYIAKKAKKQIYAFKYLENLQDLTFNSHIKNIHHFQHEGNNYIIVNEENNCLAHLFKWKQAQFSHVASFEAGLTTQMITISGLPATLIVSRSDIQRSGCLVEGTNLWIFQNESLHYMFGLADLILLHDSLIPGTFYGIYSNGVAEFKISYPELSVITYRTWNINDSNLTFVPRGLRTGLAVRNGDKLYHLIQEELTLEDSLEHEFPPVISGKVIERDNYILPGYRAEEILTIRVGIPDSMRILVAVATHEESTVNRGVDLIKIYDDVIKEKLFQNIPSHKPSSLAAMEFGNGETLLIFLQDQNTIEIYEYKGIEGFKHRSSAKIEGSKLFVANLPTVPNKSKSAVLGVIRLNQISIFEAVMHGNQFDEKELGCEL